MSNEKLALLILVFGIINISVIIGALIYHIHSKVKKRIRQSKVEHFGDSAEKKVVDFLKKNFPRAVIMEDVYLKTPTGLTEIDVILISDRGIFIIEVKSHNGYIVTNGKLWIQRWRDKVIRFHNPVEQNNIHKTALEAVFRKRQSLASLPIYAVTVFTSSNVTFSRNVKDVIKLSSLPSYIKRRKPDRRMTRDMRKRVENYISSNMETSRLKQNQHKKRIYQHNQRKRAYRINK
ncbi:MAG: NERD domain-containing protein [Clostridia bacterium]|nr:NERD domain-containing protein [Clostridia bacterium]